MIVRPDKLFIKDYKAIKRNRPLVDRLEAVLLKIEQADTVENLSGVKHILDERYRIRVGDYRLGFRMEDEELVLERFLHRKEIYRYFPPK